MYPSLMAIFCARWKMIRDFLSKMMVYRSQFSSYRQWIFGLYVYIDHTIYHCRESLVGVMSNDLTDLINVDVD